MNEGESTGQLPLLRSPFEKRMFFVSIVRYKIATQRDGQS